MLEFGEEALDAIALLVEFAILGPLHLPVPFGRDDDIGSGLFDPVAQMISVIAFVGKDCLRFEAVDKVVCQSDVIVLPWRSDQADRQAKCLRRGMDLRA